MAAKVQNTSLSQTLMLVCMGTGILLMGVQWRQITALAAFSLPKLESAKPNLEPVKQVAPLPPSKVVAKVVVDLSDRRVYLYKKNKLAAKYSVAIGQAGWETPVGSFKVFQLSRNPVWQHPITGQKVPPGVKNPLGKRWIGFSTEDGFLIGFHGTNEEALIGQAVSHGCVRMRNSDISKLYREVAIGTPVLVKP